MTDTRDETDDGLTEDEKPLWANADGSANWPVIRKHFHGLVDERNSMQATLDREREDRRQVEAERATDSERIGDLTAELAFTKAGVDTSSGAGALFARVYDGELTPDTVQASYAQYLADARAASAQFAAHVVRTTNGDIP